MDYSLLVFKISWGDYFKQNTNSNPDLVLIIKIQKI
jgi:hypothetical protein